MNCRLPANITPAWQVIGGFTQQRASVREGAEVAQDGTTSLPYTPEHAFTLWSQYQATDAISRGRRRALHWQHAPR
ncbi:TonB-dependent receptor Fiu [Kluyvera cryocrescens]|uniref:TonB-dependent receptor Fiu n=1 Tax=Kluyvera cryocrescens TaxID=580 RepID=A0A485ATV9_KLUCR|nr:TonB-dependent receptor Fiu [Kluyvera cryocrescens]